MTDRTDDVHAVNRAQKRDKQRLDQERADFQWLMSQPQGRRWIWALLERCHVFETSFTGNSHTFFREGERNVGLSILSDIDRHCPNRLPEMMIERNKANAS